MRSPRTQLVLVSAVGLTVALALSLPAPGASAADHTPGWVRHVSHYGGGISNGVRERLAAASGQLVAPAAAKSLVSSKLVGVDNVQLNGDTDPPLPQDEPSVALDASDPMDAVAASNDYTGDGFWIGYTTDGGQTWTSQWKDPKFSFDGGRCFASDPSVVYSVRDDAFYLSTLCYFPTTPASEVQVWKSVDGGVTWSDSTKAALVISNHAPDGTIDASVFYDKELMAVDNDPSSPYFGRIYVTFTKFHMTGGSYARSDYCPIQAAYTDDVPTADPSSSVWSHTAIAPDDPGAHGIGISANQFSSPVVDSQHGLDIAFVSEDCNTSLDRAILFARSTDGGASFGDIVRVDGPGQFVDNPNRGDQLPGKGPVRFPISPSLAYDASRGRLLLAYQNNVDRTVSGADITLQRSDDFGQTWMAPIPISVDALGAAAPGDQWFPAIGTDSRGNYFAIWQDNRNSASGALTETFQGMSSDGGDTWQNVNISSVPFDPRKSFFSCGCFIGDYNQIAVSDQVIYPVWTDGRDSPPKPAGDSNIWSNVEILT
jgi:hypothetical protein